MTGPEDARSAASVRTLVELLAPHDRPFDVRLWDGTTIQAHRPPEFTIVLRDPRALGRMLTPPFEKSLATAFVTGSFDVEGDAVAGFRHFERMGDRRWSPAEIAQLARAVLALPRDRKDHPDMPAPARLRGRLHSPGRDRDAIRHHYDVGNAFYALWLDRRMQYSCAYFERPSMTLDEAQEAKLDLVCRKLRLSPGERLLDVGCGWGGLAIHAARKFRARVVGITLSPAQAAHARDAVAREGLADVVEIREQDYRSVPDGPFDKIASIGMFEHVGRPQLARYFHEMRGLLAPGGLFLNHGISLRPSTGSPVPGALRKSLLGSGWFIPRYVFPDGELLPVSEANLVAEREGLEVRDVENLREHYARTLRHWVERLEAHREDAIALTSEATYRTWRLYMAGSANAFERGRISVNQTLLAAPTPDGQVSLPATRADIYRSLEDTDGASLRVAKLAPSPANRLP